MISLKYHNAMSIQRFLAFFIDYFLVGLVATLILGFIPLYEFHSNEMIDLSTAFLSSTDIDLVLAINLLRSAGICLLFQVAIYVPIIVLYQIVLPLLWKHQTVGRLVAGVRVMKLNKDEKPGVGSLIVRELVGGFIFNTLFIQTFVLPILNYIFSRNRGRSLADMISKTRLIDYKLAKAEENVFGTVHEEPKQEDFINAEFNEVNTENNEEVETEYKVF